MKPSEIKPAKEATAAEMLASYDSLVAQITSINAAVEMVPTAGSAYSGVIEQYHQVQGFILAQKPASIRVIGQAPVLAKNIFDMASDASTFRIYIPSKNQFIVGPAALERPAGKPIENLRPQHLLDAIFWPAVPPGAPALFEEFDQPPDRFYVITQFEPGEPPHIQRKLWFDRADLTLARIQSYGAAGRIVSDVHLSEWQPAPVAAAEPVESAVAGSPSTGANSQATPTVIYPRHLLVRRPHDDYQLDIRITRLTLNEKISPERFTLAQPPGTQLTRLGESHP